jgi:hypothetical protein
MSTTIKFKNTILDDYYSPFVLAWIEKNGATSEEEILFDTKLDRPVLKNILVKLFDNEFITTHKNYFKISTEGKYILDRLNISKNLLQLTLQELNSETENSETDFNDVLIIFENYRNNFYENYLNTQRRLNIWNRITNTKEFETKTIQFKNICKQAIISNDILKTYGKYSSDSKSRVFITLNNEPKEFEIGSTTWKYLEILKSIKNIKSLSLINKEEDEDTKFFIEFETLNNIFPSEKHHDDWFDVFNSFKTKDINERTLKSYTRFKKNMFHQIDTAETDELKLKFFSLPLQETNLKPLYDTLFLLESNSDLNELAESLNISTNKTSLIIKDLKRAVEKHSQ